MLEKPRISQEGDAPTPIGALRRALPGVVLTIVGVVITFAVFDVLRDRQRDAQTRTFAKRAVSLAAAVRSQFEATVEVLEGVRALVVSAPDLSSESFERFVASPLHRYPAVAALEWAPLVTAQDRSAFEVRAQEQGLVGFRITELTDGGSMEPARDRDVFVPILFMQPAGEAVGFDVVSDPGRRAIAWSARDSGEATASGRFRLAEDGEGVYSVAVYLPVYAGAARGSGAWPASPAARRERFSGVAIAVCRVAKVLARALPRELSGDLDVALIDRSAPASEQLLFASREGLQDAEAEGGVSWATVVDFAGRRWELRFASRTPFSAGVMPWLVLLAGLSASLLLGVGIGALRTIVALRHEVAAARKLDQYTLVEELGKGGMGTVYRAEHALLRRPTAVKLLAVGGGVNVKRFAREVQITSSLTHPNTVAIYDYGRTPDGTFYYAMEYLEGISLEELVQLDGAQPPARVIRILVQTCGALAEAHSVGLIHRDIKPANLMLTRRGLLCDFVKVLDFGLVKKTEGTDAGVTSANSVVGTPLYLSPEAISDPESVEARSDLYALGAVAYYLLTGTDVFFGTSVVDICTKHLRAEPAAMSTRGVSVPEPLEALVMQCLAKRVEDRPASALALIEALQALPIERWTWGDAEKWWGEHGADILERAGAAREKSEPGSAKKSIDVDATERRSSGAAD